MGSVVCSLQDLGCAPNLRFIASQRREAFARRARIPRSPKTAARDDKWNLHYQAFPCTTMPTRKTGFTNMGTADVVSVGGGIVGSSIAYHLVEAGCRSVLVIERETSQGKGSTGKSMGGVRAQFATPVNIKMSLYSI